LCKCIRIGGVDAASPTTADAKKTAEIMKHKVPGIYLPEDVFRRITEASDPAKEGIGLARETIDQLKGMANGIHMMSIDSLEHFPDILAGTMD
jgi:hypothetical protein